MYLARAAGLFTLRDAPWQPSERKRACSGQESRPHRFACSVPASDDAEVCCRQNSGEIGD